MTASGEGLEIPILKSDPGSALWDNEHVAGHWPLHMSSNSIINKADKILHMAHTLFYDI